MRKTREKMAAMNQKPNEAGWFYQAPARKVYREPVLAPPPSQIPGLGDIEPLQPDVPKEMYFKETDTKYVRLAKMGGRKDLLAIKPNPNEKKEPVPYPRSEWFYLEDNAMEDEKLKKPQDPWKFLLPEYMVHEAYGSTTVDGSQRDIAAPVGNTVPMRRAPWATDDQMAQFKREGQSMTDKTVRLPELRRPGYGVRNGKPPPKAPVMPDRTQPKVQGQQTKLKYQALPEERQEPINMAKLLSNTYEREWHEKLTIWQEQQKQNWDKAPTQAKGDEQPARSEYGSTYSNHSKSAASQRRPNRFKNIPAKVNTHQSPGVLAAVGN